MSLGEIVDLASCSNMFELLVTLFCEFRWTIWNCKIKIVFLSFVVTKSKLLAASESMHKSREKEDPQYIDGLIYFSIHFPLIRILS